MKNRTLFLRLSLLGMSLACVPLSGCNYIQRYEVHQAYSDYQQAIGRGDLKQARGALRRLVRIDQDEGSYWLELGKLELRMNNYAGAYNAFTRAHELDRSNVPVLATMAQLALLNNQMQTASQQADSLALLAPNNPVVTLVRSYAAFDTGNLDKAEAGADTLLQASPDDSFANVLKAKVLIGRGRLDQAAALLENQHQTVPDDAGAIRVLTAIYRAQGDWRNAARIESDWHRLEPRDSDVALGAIEALLRSGDVERAREISAPFVAAGADSRRVDQVLEKWARYAKPGVVLPGAMQLANAAPSGARVAFANYFNEVGKPASAAALLGASRLPVTHLNARFNAVLAQSLALRGQTESARELFDLVLGREPDQVDALRGRSILEAQSGAARQAIIDAQRLVTTSPESGADRILLARAYLAAHDGPAVRRTLWQAFQDLPGDERVFAALKNVLSSTGHADEARRLNDEFADRRGAKLMKDLV